MAEVNLRGVNKSFGSVSVIRNLNLEISHGELIVFVGPSGCGKSTLLRMIAGLENISAGELFIDGIECSSTAPKDRGIAMVFQSYALYPHMSVYDNVGFALKLAKMPKLDRDAKIHETARVLQMEHLLDRKPAQLSGGQRQRVAIGRAIVRQPKVFLFDEPLSNLDAALRGDMRIEIAKLHQELGATMIYVTHDQVEAMTLADRIVVLNEGVVQQVGAPLDLYERPANLFVAGFIGAPKMNLLAVNVQSTTDTTLGVGSDIVRTTVFQIERMDRQLTEACVLGIRPQQLRLSEMDKAQLAGVVTIVEHLGSETILNVELDNGKRSLLATLAGNVRIKPGEQVGLAFEPEDAHLFLKSGPRLPTVQHPLA